MKPKIKKGSKSKLPKNRYNRIRELQKPVMENIPQFRQIWDDPDEKQGKTDQIEPNQQHPSNF